MEREEQNSKISAVSIRSEAERAEPWFFMQEIAVVLSERRRTDLSLRHFWKKIRDRWITFSSFQFVERRDTSGPHRSHILEGRRTPHQPKPEAFLISRDAAIPEFWTMTIVGDVR